MNSRGRIEPDLLGVIARAAELRHVIVIIDPWMSFPSSRSILRLTTFLGLIDRSRPSAT